VKGFNVSDYVACQRGAVCVRDGLHSTFSISRHVTGLFAVLRTIIIFTAVSLDITQRRLVQTHFFSEEQSAFMFIVAFSYRANRGNTSFQTIGTYLPNYTVSPHGRQDITFIVTDVKASNCTPVYLFVSPNIKV